MAAVSPFPEVDAPAPAAGPRAVPSGVIDAAFLLVQTALAFALFAPAWSHPTATLVGDQYDSGYHAWLLNWTPFALGHGDNPLFSNWIGYPHGANLAWNPPVILPGLVLWPVNALAGPIVAFNLWFPLAVAAGAFTTYLVLLRYTASRLGAAAGATLFGFSPYALAHAAAGHTDLVMVASIPVLLLIVDDIAVRRRRSPLFLGATLGVVAAVQAYLAEEVLATEAIAAVMGLLVLAAVVAPRVRSLLMRAATRRLLHSSLIAAPVFLLLTAPLLWMQFAGPQHLSGTIWPRSVYVTDVANLVVPTRIQAVAPAAATSLTHRFTGNLGEWDGYVSIPVLVLVVAEAWWQRRRVVVRWAFVMAVVMTVLSLGPKLHVGGHETSVPLPWDVLGRVPPLDNVLPGRMMVFTFFACALLLACGIDAALRQSRNVVRGLGAALLVVSAVALFPAVPFAHRSATVPAFFIATASRVAPAGTVAYVLPSVTPESPLWQLRSGMRLRMVGGYFLGLDAQGKVHIGPAETPLSRAVADVESSGDIAVLSPQNIARYRAELRTDHVETIVVTPFEHHAATVIEFFRRLTGTPPRDDGAGSFYWARLGGTL